MEPNSMRKPYLMEKGLAECSALKNANQNRIKNSHLFQLETLCYCSKGQILIFGRKSCLEFIFIAMRTTKTKSLNQDICGTQNNVFETPER
jgi:hypothetical protein